MARLAGKAALVTGAARGQSAATARRFVAEGVKVVIADILDEDGAAPADELGEAAVYRHLDVTDEQQWETVVTEPVSVFGAGVLHFASLSDTRLADYERVIRNQFGTFLGMRAAVEPMRRACGGSIVNISSVEGLAGSPLLVAYTAGKFAIRGMTKVGALELGVDGIRVNSVHPGMIDTKMVSDPLGAADVPTDWVKQKVPLGRVGQADEIADVTLFLASDESSYCTGGEFAADGGATATHGLKV